MQGRLITKFREGLERGHLILHVSGAQTDMDVLSSITGELRDKSMCIVESSLAVDDVHEVMITVKSTVISFNFTVDRAEGAISICNDDAMRLVLNYLSSAVSKTRRLYPEVETATAL